MASCTRVEGMIQAYVDEELSASDRVILEEHMSNCLSCAAVLRRHRSLCAELFEAYADKRLRHDLRPGVLEHLPEMEPRSADLADVNWRAKHTPRSRFATKYVPVVAIAIVAVLGFANYYYWPKSEEPRPAVGQVIQSIGGAEESRSDARGWMAVMLGRVVRSDERFQTAQGGMLMLALQGSSTLKLNEQTQLRVHDHRWISLDKGEVWLDVGRDGHRFKVDTPNGTVVVLGTAFAVRVGPEGTTVTVERGTVRVENDGASTLVKQGQQVSLTSKGAFTETQAVDPQQVSPWARLLVPPERLNPEFRQAQMHAAGKAELAAKEMFVLEQPAGPRRWAFTSINVYWLNDEYSEGHCSYDVYVYDDQMQPLFKESIPGNVFDVQGNGSFALSVPGGPIVGVRQLMVRLVPDFSSGTVQPKGVSVSGVFQTVSLDGGTD